MVWRYSWANTKVSYVQITKCPNRYFFVMDSFFWGEKGRWKINTINRQQFCSSSPYGHWISWSHQFLWGRHIVVFWQRNVPIGQVSEIRKIRIRYMPFQQLFSSVKIQWNANRENDLNRSLACKWKTYYCISIFFCINSILFLNRIIMKKK